MAIATTVITSIQNSIINSFKKLLANKKYRIEANSFVAISKRVIDTLVANKLTIDSVLICHDHKLYNSHLLFAKKLTSKIFACNQAIFNQLSIDTGSDGIMAIFKIPSQSANNQKLTSKVLVLDHIQDPRNLAAICRSCLALGFETVYLTSQSVDRFHPMVIKQSLGASVILNLQTNQSYDQVMTYLNKQGFDTYATCMTNKAIDLSQIKKLNLPFALVFGNEGAGLNDKQIALCQKQIKIAIASDRMESLNVAAAAAICMHWFTSK